MYHNGCTGHREAKIMEAKIMKIMANAPVFSTAVLQLMNPPQSSRDALLAASTGISVAASKYVISIRDRDRTAEGRNNCPQIIAAAGQRPIWPSRSRS